MNKLPVSALVASCNEAHYLEDCLKSLWFCDEIYGVDLDSDDASMEIFQRYADKVERHPKVPLIEKIHPVYIPRLKHDWIILIDPDERIMPELAISIEKALSEADDNISVLRVPMINHFKGKPLKGTIYGSIVHARLLYKKSGITIDDDVHNGIKIKPGYERRKIPFNGKNYDQHLWCDSWSQLLDKHRRYLSGEGQSRYNQGARYSFTNQWSSALKKFYYNFKGSKGYKDGWRGFLISVLQARYEFIAWNELRRYAESKAKQIK